MKERPILPLIFGIESTILSAEEIEFFHNNPIRGIILFSRNIESEEQVIALNKSIKELYHDRTIPIFVDQEGGRVARIRPPVARKEYPPAEYFAKLYEKDKDQAAAELYDNYFQIMDEAGQLGFDSLCAPVCDLRYEGASDVIGDRSFGDNPEQVVTLASAAIQAIFDTGGIPFIKHIPGHGRALVDSHYELPYVDTSLPELMKTDFVPFQELQYEGIWGMTAHIVYKQIDAKTPITMSKKGIDYIRKNVFDGVLVTDDVGMFALHGEVGTKKALLKRVIAMADKGDDWTCKYGDLFAEMFDAAICKMPVDEVLQFCHQEEATIEEEFLHSLALVSKLSIEAGCDYVLHCSGNMKEMQAIVAAFDITFT